MFVKRITTISIAALLLLPFGCKDNPIEPPIKEPRTYTWTVDTLAYPGSFQTWMRDIYATSPQNVWTVGYNATSGGKMYHYDGKEWRDMKLHTFEGGKIIPGFNLNALYSFSAQDIWAVGERHCTIRDPLLFLDSSLIIHFDGRDWTESNISRGGELRAIWGSNPMDIWAVRVSTRCIITMAPAGRSFRYGFHPKEFNSVILLAGVPATYTWSGSRIPQASLRSCYITLEVINGRL